MPDSSTSGVIQPEANTPNSGMPEHVPSQWAWHYRTLCHLRDRLARAHTEHTNEVSNPSEMLGVDVADTAQEQAVRDLLWAELAAEDDQLFEVDCALQRIHDGVYGFCEETGNVIPPERLRAVPWTRYCRTVAEEREKKRARGWLREA
jgi:RNA polymerase-binding transcription factor DksA